MAQIDREGTFRGLLIDHGISETKNGFPQFVCKFKATEIWDPDEEAWVDWTGYDVNEITGYFVLVGGKGETLSCKQLAVALPWDGISFTDLQTGDYAEVIVQFRVELHTFEENTTLQVQWIDAYDAIPGNAIRKLDAADIKKLDALYKRVTKKPASKSTAKPKTPGIVTKIDNKGKTSDAPASTPTSAPAAPAAPAPAPAPAAPTSAPAPAPPTDENGVEGKCTKDDAWEAVCDMKKPGVTDEQVGNVWLASVKEVGGKKLAKDFTNEEWFLVRESVLNQTAVF